MMAVEVAAPAEGGRPRATLLREFVYPEGMSFAAPQPLGEALGAFLREQNFSARSAVVGLPAKWMVVKAKEVPPADRATLAEMLRLQAEGEFSSELKDLVYDYAAAAPVSGGGSAAQSVLLIATPQKYVDAAVTLCEAAKLSPLGVMPSATALGCATGRATKRDELVLTIGPSGAELTSQQHGIPAAIRSLRPPAADRPFVGDLRRAVSSMPVNSNGSKRELIIWNASPVPTASLLDAEQLSQSLGMPVRAGDLPVLGIDTADDIHRNCQGRQFAAAAALALTALPLNDADVGVEAPVDFLHTRLAPPKQSRLPSWTTSAILGGVILLGLAFLAWNTLQNRQSEVDRNTRLIALNQPDYDTARAFVTRVHFAQRFYNTQPRYLACLRDMTWAIPDDHQTYVTGLTFREIPKPPAGTNVKPPNPNTLVGQLTGRTSNQGRALAVLDALKRIPAFTEVELPGTAEAGRAREIQFTITFHYLATATSPAAGPTTAPAGRH